MVVVQIALDPDFRNQADGGESVWGEAMFTPVARRAHFPSRAHAFICAMFCSVRFAPVAFPFRFPSPT